MKKTEYQSQLAGAISKRDSWKYVAIGLLLSNVLLAWFVFTADLKEKTIVTPVGFSKSFWVHGDKVDPRYLEEMGDMFAGWLKNYHSDNVTHQFEQVLKYSDPRVHAEMKAWLDSEAQRVKRNELASIFYPLGININGHQVDIKARILGMVGSQVVTDKIQVLRLAFKYVGGRLIISGFQDGRVNESGLFESEDVVVGALAEHVRATRKQSGE